VIGLVRDDDPLAHPAPALDRRVHRRQGLGRGSGGATLGGFRTFLQASRAAARRLCLALEEALGVALLGGARRARLARVLGPRPAAALLR
jgi:hypothetical protein